MRRSSVLGLGVALLLTGCGPKDDGAGQLPAVRGKTLIQRYGCATCHIIPGFPGAPKIGPSLEGLGARTELAGSLPHTEENLIRWIRNPRSVVRNTAMPTLGVTEEDARAITAYLYEVGGGSAPAATPAQP